MLSLATACGPSAQVEEAEVTAALQAVADWLTVDDEPDVTTAEATDRARRLVAATQPLVEARPPVEGLDADQTREFHDALTALRDSVAAQREVLADCTLPDPATCLAQSDLDPADLAATVERFQSALDPLLDADPTPGPAA